MKKITIILMLVAATIGQAQESIVQRVLKGSASPATYELKDLPDDYQAMDLSVQNDRQSILGLLSLSMSSMGGGTLRSDYLTTYWTNGTELTDESGAKFLVTYSAVSTALTDMRSFQSSMPAGIEPAATKAPTLRLTLIKESSISSMTPRPDLTKADWLAISAGRVTPHSMPATRSAALSNIKQAGLATIIYTNDYDDLMPIADDSATAAKELLPYAKNPSVFKSLNPAGGLLRYNTHLSRVSASSVERPAETIIWFDSLAWPDGLHLVAYVDGHAKFIDEATWQQQRLTLDRRYHVVDPPAHPAKALKTKGH